jgi:hypothetical protein
MKKKKLDPFIKASRKGSRDAEMENDGRFKSVTKVHKSKKAYSRKDNRNHF